jgi:hypothetical protein
MGQFTQGRADEGMLASTLAGLAKAVQRNSEAIDRLLAFLDGKPAAKPGAEPLPDECFGPSGEWNDDALIDVDRTIADDKAASRPR